MVVHQSSRPRLATTTVIHWGSIMAQDGDCLALDRSKRWRCKRWISDAGGGVAGAAGVGAGKATLVERPVVVVNRNPS